MAVGSGYLCALDRVGTVRCSGSNGTGQLGDGTTVDRNGPAAVTGLTAVTSLSTYRDLTCATTRDGAVWCWGAVGRARSGTGSTSTVATRPVGVVGVG